MDPPQHAAEARRRLAMVHVIMDHVIGEIAGREAGKDRPCQRKAEDKCDYTEGGKQDRAAEQDRHDEPQRVVRMVVMHAVNEEMQTLAELARDLPMEEIAVAQIFGQRPNDVTEEHAAKRGREARPCEAQIGEKRNDGRIDVKRHAPVHARQLVE